MVSRPLLSEDPRGPTPLRPTVIGRAAGVVTNAVLLGLALALLLRPDLLRANWIEWPVNALYLVVGVNVAYLTYQRVRTWDAAERGTTG